MAALVVLVKLLAFLGRSARRALKLPVAGVQAIGVVWAVLLYPMLFRPSAVRDRVYRIAVYVLAYATRWGLVFFVIWSVAPQWLVSAPSGLQTVLQAVPATVVALYVLVLGSVFVVAQLALTAYGTRAALLLVGDAGVQQLVVRPVLVTIAALLLAGRVPGGTAPVPPWITALTTTTALATVVALVQTTTSLPTVLSRYTAPVNFGMLVMEDVERDLQLGFTGLVVFKAPLLGEMLRTSVTRGDTPAIRAGLEAIRHMYDAYLRATQTNPNSRSHTYDDGSATTGWMASALGEGLVHAGEEALRSGSSEEDTDQIAMTTGVLAQAALTRRYDDEAEMLVSCLLMMGLTVHQITATGAFNFYARPVNELAYFEAAAETGGRHGLAVHALASWALAVAYPEFHYGFRDIPCSSPA